MPTRTDAGTNRGTGYGGGLQLTAGQLTFLNEFVRKTKLNPNVVAAWLYSEENGVYAQARDSAHNYNYLNIGYTDSGQRGTGATFWTNPITAADVSAAWLRGAFSVPGFGKASAGVRSIAGTAGGTPAAQVAAIQHSGWASSGYPSLGELYVKSATQGNGGGGGGFDIGAAIAKAGGAAKWLAQQGIDPNSSSGKWLTDQLKNIGIGGGLTGGSSGVGGLNPFSGIDNFFSGILDPNLWLRVGQVAAGGALVFMGLYLLTRQVGLAVPSVPTPVRTAAGAVG